MKKGKADFVLKQNSSVKPGPCFHIFECVNERTYQGFWEWSNNSLRTNSKSGCSNSLVAMKTAATQSFGASQTVKVTSKFFSLPVTGWYCYSAVVVNKLSNIIERVQRETVIIMRVKSFILYLVMLNIKSCTELSWDMSCCREMTDETWVTVGKFRDCQPDFISNDNIWWISTV